MEQLFGKTQPSVVRNPFGAKCILAGIPIGAIIAVAVFVCFNEPTAMDVYRGKTALKYTYVDSVKVDSVVIFKGRK